jgi:hypothetical protein
MNESFEESNQGCLIYLTREIILSIIVAILLSVPCILFGTWILSSGD